jgi:NADPH:quinone reductase-like Zn-dependent oxidoreductase
MRSRIRRKAIQLHGGQTILVTGAAGNVERIAVLVAGQYGAKVIRVTFHLLHFAGSTGTQEIWR